MLRMHLWWRRTHSSRRLCNVSFTPGRELVPQGQAASQRPVPRAPGDAHLSKPAGPCARRRRTALWRRRLPVVRAQSRATEHRKSADPQQIDAFCFQDFRTHTPTSTPRTQARCHGRHVCTAGGKWPSQPPHYLCSRAAAPAAPQRRDKAYMT